MMSVVLEGEAVAFVKWQSKKILIVAQGIFKFDFSLNKTSQQP